MITGHTFTMTITPDELKNIIREVINESNKDKTQQPKEQKLYTRKEATQLLHISLSTLDTYLKKGAIKASRVGTRVLISQDDIDAALQKNRIN